MLLRLHTVAIALLLAAPAFAAEAPAEKLPADAKVTALKVTPLVIQLDGPFAYTRFIVSATLATGETVDVTRIADIKYPDVVTSTSVGFVRSAKAGNGSIAISLGGQSAALPVVVAMPQPVPAVSFVKDVQPVLSKLGCNAGTCHGSAQGKNGFKLSLRGYDPIFDHRALTDDLEGRRFNRAAPEKSLMLMKPAGAVAHAGGVVLQPDDSNYALIRKWIADGVKQDLAAPRVKSIEVFPNAVTVPVVGMKQQFRVTATYTDGSTRDVSAEAFIDSSNTDVATVDKTSGLLTTVRRGEATMLARYEGAYAAANVVITGDRSGFQWQARPVNNYIDDLVDAKLKKVKIQPSDLCDDAEFYRRVSIDLTGLPPTADEVRKFLSDVRPSKTKREAVIDQLIGSDIYVDHWTNKWGDLLQVNRKFLGDKGAASLRMWVRDALVKNMPYDQFAYAILTASGSTAENPAAAYFKTLRTPDAVMENTTQLFMAIRFNCNKCHDHPFEKWTQDQYYQTAAFFAQVNRKEDPKFKGQKIGGSAVEGAKPLVEVIEDTTSGEVTHERTGQVTKPLFPFTHANMPKSDLSRRVQVAKWATAKENPYFAKSHVNRIWSYLLGTGIIEPVDDIRAGNPATNPELLDRMTQEFIDSGFDTRKLMKTICQSRTYQLSISTNQWNKDDDLNYSHAIPRRLPAEVLFDSIHRATGATSHLPGLPAGARASQLVDGNVDLPGGFLELLGKPVRESACECERSNTMMLGPILAMVNGPIVADAIKDPTNYIVRFTEKEKDDKKVVEEIYLSVLNRKPTAKEVAVGVQAIADAASDMKRIAEEYKIKKDQLDAYTKQIDGKVKAFEEGLLVQQPSKWTTITPTKAESKAGPTRATAKEGATLKVQTDGSILVSGKSEAYDQYTVTSEAKTTEPITGLRIEVLTDPSLPAKGPGRAENGNFVLSELVVAAHGPKDDKTKPGKPVKLANPQATFEQPAYLAANAIDNNRATGWAIHPQVGKDNIAIFQFQPPLVAKDGVTLSVTLEQEFGQSHSIGKFRLSFTTEKNPKLKSAIAADLAAILATPADKRTPAQTDRIRQMYLSQDADYLRLSREVPPILPADHRVLGAQDLTWALINSPSFLFNR